MEKTVKELCLVCGGERWLPDPLDASRSIACVYCDQLGWVEISLVSLGEAAPTPRPAAAQPAPAEPSATPERPQPPAKPLRKKQEPPASPPE